MWECVEDCPVRLLNEQTGTLRSGKDVNPTKESVKGFFGSDMSYYSQNANYGDSGGASRFFYQAKANKKERNAGLGDGKNIHATVKPLKLMEYLCKLTRTPTGGIVLDPFMGSGTTGMACVNTDRNFIGIEMNEEYFEIAKRRINHAKAILKID